MFVICAITVSLRSLCSSRVDNFFMLAWRETLYAEQLLSINAYQVELTSDMEATFAHPGN